MDDDAVISFVPFLDEFRSVDEGWSEAGTGKLRHILCSLVKDGKSGQS